MIFFFLGGDNEVFHSVQVKQRIIIFLVFRNPRFQIIVFLKLQMSVQGGGVIWLVIHGFSVFFRDSDLLYLFYFIFMLQSKIISSQLETKDIFC